MTEDLLRWGHRHQRWLLPLVLALATGFCLWRLGDHGLRLWDETRYGENALQMLGNHDYLNYYFNGAPDNWVAKPPLGIWAIALSYKVFGFNEFAMRFPAAVAGVVCVLLTFLIVRLYKGPLSATLACIILMTCRGIIGPHVARNADLDAIFIACLLSALYFVLKAVRDERGASMIWGAFFGGLAFYAKGFAGGLVVPGLAFYIVWKGQLKRWLTAPSFWIAAGVFCLFVLSWYSIVKTVGTYFPNPEFGHDAWETMTRYDIFARFTSKIEADDTSPLFPLVSLDTRFAPWIYVFYVSVIILAIKTPAAGKALLRTLRSNDLVALSICLAGTVVGLLTVSQTRFNWYIAPAIPFLAILTSLAARRAAALLSPFQTIFSLCFVGGLGLQIYSLYHSDNSLADQITAHKAEIAGAEHVYVKGRYYFNHELALKWLGKVPERPPEALPTTGAQVISPNISRLASANGYVVVLDAGS